MSNIKFYERGCPKGVVVFFEKVFLKQRKLCPFFFRNREIWKDMSQHLCMVLAGVIRYRGKKGYSYAGWQHRTDWRFRVGIRAKQSLFVFVPVHMCVDVCHTHNRIWPINERLWPDGPDLRTPLDRGVRRIGTRLENVRGRKGERERDRERVRER